MGGVTCTSTGFPACVPAVQVSIYWKPIRTASSLEILFGRIVSGFNNFQRHELFVSANYKFNEHGSFDLIGFCRRRIVDVVLNILFKFIFASLGKEGITSAEL